MSDWRWGDEDPTKLNEVEDDGSGWTDPLMRRMRGRTNHGNVYFDVPFISELAPNLWQGGCEYGLVLPDFIEHVVSLYPWERYSIAPRHEVSSELYVRMYDSEGQGFDQVYDLARWVNKCREEGPTLVHCQAGLNRSSLVAGTALLLEGMGGDEVIDLIREKRSPACLCNPAFERWLRDGAILEA